MTFWIEYETPGCLHEYDPVVLQEFHVVFPRLSYGPSRWEGAYVQKYTTKDGKIRWRSLDSKRSVYSKDHLTREEAGRKVLESPVVRARIAGRRRTLALRRRGQEPWYNPWDCPPKG